MNGGVVGLDLRETGKGGDGVGCGGGGGGEAAASAVTLEMLRKKMSDFARERDWEQFHSPRNLLLALVGEVGELSEIFQWKGEVPKGLPGWGEREVEHLGEELADVLLYLVRLSDMCSVDLGKAALRKMELNARKYPVGQCRGSSKKHTHYSTVTDNNNAASNDDKCNAGDEDKCNAGAGNGEEQC